MKNATEYVNTSRLSILVHRLFKSESPFLRPFQLIVRIVLHLEIPRLFFRQGLFLAHPYNIIVHSNVTMGANVTIYQNVTIANVWNGKKKGTPTIEDNVIIYPHSVILGNLTIGKNSIVGAGSVVIANVPPDCVVAGNPSRVVNKLSDNRPIEIRRYF